MMKGWRHESFADSDNTQQPNFKEAFVKAVCWRERDLSKIAHGCVFTISCLVMSTQPSSKECVDTKPCATCLTSLEKIDFQRKNRMLAQIPNIRVGNCGEGK